MPQLKAKGPLVAGTVISNPASALWIAHAVELVVLYSASLKPTHTWKGNAAWKGRLNTTQGKTGTVKRQREWEGLSRRNQTWKGESRS